MSNPKFSVKEMIKYLRTSKEFGKVDSEYTKGLVNGIELALAYLEKREPIFHGGDMRTPKEKVAHEMYELLDRIYSVDPRELICLELISKIPELLKKARGEK